MRLLPPPFLPPLGEDFDYGLFMSDQIELLIHYWEMGIVLTESPEETLKAFIQDSLDDNQ